ncbi:RNA polymerase-associated protein rtf1 [Cryptotrichosporon argae]
MSDLENELLGLAEDDPRKSKKRASGSRKPASQAYIEDSDDEEQDMDMDVESEEDDAKPAPKKLTNPYPLEGKYIDEDDREHLESLPEIERENILANRQEEMQRFKDAAQLDAMYKMAGMGEADDEDDEGPSRKRRKHAPNEASRTLNQLKDARRAKDERTQRRVAKRERRAHSPLSDASSEEGEIDERDAFRPTSPRGRSPVVREKETERDLDSVPANREELNGARLGRYDLVDLMFKTEFEQVVTGAYVRLMALEPDTATGRPKYRIHRIEGVETGRGRYKIEYKGREVSDDRGLMCAYGRSKRLWRIADVSNGDFEEGEFSRYSLTNAVDKIPPPCRSDLKRKQEEIVAARDRPMTDAEVSRQIETRKNANRAAQRHQTVVEIGALMKSRALAMRRNDRASADELARKIVELGGDPATGELVDGAGEQNSDYDAMIQRINENNKRKTKEAMAKAHEAALARRRAEEAIVKAKTQRKLSEAEIVAVPAAPPASGLRKGETPQQYVARTIDLDLGDF